MSLQSDERERLANGLLCKMYLTDQEMDDLMRRPGWWAFWLFFTVCAFLLAAAAVAANT